MEENIYPQIDKSVLVGHLSEEDRQVIVELSKQPGWNVLLEKIILPRSRRVISEIASGKSMDKEEIFRDVMFTRGQLYEHGLLNAIILACKTYKKPKDKRGDL